MCDEMRDNEVILAGKEMFIINTFNVVCDKLIAEINRRTKVYANILDIFKTFINLDLDETKFSTNIDKLISIYKNDIDLEKVKNEVIQFLLFIKEENIWNNMNEM